jgi:hypothetical protein
MLLLSVGCIGERHYTVVMGKKEFKVDSCWIEDGDLGYWIGDDRKIISSCSGCQCNMTRGE